MSDAQARGWGDPDASNYRQRHIIKVRAGGVDLWVRREVAHLFQGFCNELVERGYRLDVQADDWGYNNRDIRGRPGVKSNHAWGLAIDLNSAANPMSDNGKPTDMPAWVGEAARAWGLFWGANYQGRKDPMHFEFLGTPRDVPAGRNPARITTQRPAPAAVDQEDDMTLYTPVDDNGNTHDANGKPYAPPMLVQGNTFTYLGTMSEVDVVKAGGAAERKARPFMVAIIKHLCAERPR